MNYVTPVKAINTLPPHKRTDSDKFKSLQEVNNQFSE